MARRFDNGASFFLVYKNKTLLKQFIPWQNSPSYKNPFGQTQSNDPIVFSHVDSLGHGMLAHSLISRSYNTKYITTDDPVGPCPNVVLPDSVTFSSLSGN